MGSAKGIDHLLKQTALVDAFTELLKEAKSDDGKVTLTDVLSKSVLMDALELFEHSKAAVKDYDAMMEEIADLDTQEAMLLVAAYLKAFEDLYKALKA